MPETITHRSYCRVCTCQCGLLVDVADGRVVKVRGDREHPYSKGYTCPKGRAIGQLHDHPQAIDRPMLCRDGKLLESGWDEVLDDLATRLKTIIAKHGPASVGVFFGSGIGMDAAGFRTAEAWFAQLGTPAKFSPMTIDGCAKTLVASLVGGFPGLSPRTDYDRARSVLFFGVNPLVSHGHNIAMVNPALIVKDVAARGQVWTIDPRRNETADFATGHVAPLPGTDWAILAFLIRELLEQGLDRSAQPVASLEELRRAVSQFSRARSAEIAGVSETELEALWQTVKSGPVAVETGTGVTMAGTANVTQWLAWALSILTGAMNRPGGMWFHPGFHLNWDRMEVPLFDRPWTPGPPSRPELTGLVGDWPCAALPDEIAAGNIKALVNLGGSLIRSFPDANLLEQALGKLEVLASLEIVGNETTALSTHILPSRDQLERPEIPLWDFLASRVSAQYAPQVLPARGERRAAWWIMAELMRRMGMVVPEHVPADDRADGADEAMLAALMPQSRSTFAEVKAAGYVEHLLELPARWVDEHVAKIGGWRLAPPELVAELAGLAEDVSAQPLPYLLIPRRQRRQLNASITFLGAQPELLIHPGDAAAEGLAEGQQVRIGNDRGEVTGLVRIDPGIRRGVVSLPHGHAGANVNKLTSKDAVDKLTGMVLYSGIGVWLKGQ